MEEDDIHWTPPTRVEPAEESASQRMKESTDNQSDENRSTLLLYILVTVFLALLWMAIGQDIMDMVQ